MRFTVSHLLAKKREPVTVLPTDSGTRAFLLMREHGFSQLAVIDEKGRPQGVVTHESILRALSHFKTTLDAIRVSAAVTKVPRFEPGSDLFELLDELEGSYAALVVDDEERLIGIVTQWDTTEYFRRRAEDMMLVEDIETSLRDHVRRSFSDGLGNMARSELCEAVDEVADQWSDYQRKFQSALKSYLGRRGEKEQEVNPDWAEQAFKAFRLKKEAKELFDLTLTETISLLLHRKRWPDYEPIFGVNEKSLRVLLEPVRDIRNTLAHFRGDLSDEQREKLRFCTEWLNRHQPPEPLPTAGRIREPLVAELKASQTDPSLQTAPATPAQRKRVSSEDDAAVASSRYAHLAMHLEALPAAESSVNLSFVQIETIIGCKLPSHARKHRSWWVDDEVANFRSQQWLEAGWRITGINLPEERLSFSRIAERQQNYETFFRQVIELLPFANGQKDNLSVATGRPWLAVAWLPQKNPQASLLVSFAKDRRFRIELYLDARDCDINKRATLNKLVFDRLIEHRKEIEGELGTSLTWERRDYRATSRIALYREGSILDGEASLSELRSWVKNWAPRFHEVFDKALSGVIQPLQTDFAGAGAECPSEKGGRTS